MKIEGRLILSALQDAYKNDGDADVNYHTFVKTLLSRMFNVTIAWAAIRKGGIFEAYFYSKADTEKVRDGLGWICEIKEIEKDGDYRLLINV